MHFSLFVTQPLKFYALLLEKSLRTNVQISSVYWSIKHSVAIASLHITAAERRSFCPLSGPLNRVIAGAIYTRAIFPQFLRFLSKRANISEGLVMKTVTG